MTHEDLLELAIRYHKGVEGEYGCNGATCPGVKRLVHLLDKATSALSAKLEEHTTASTEAIEYWRNQTRLIQARRDELQAKLEKELLERQKWSDHANAVNDKLDAENEALKAKLEEQEKRGDLMIKIPKSATADTRTCDYANVSKETLLASSKQHISDVDEALFFFRQELFRAAYRHDTDKLTDIDGFHADFVTGFAQTGWWERHRKLNRHHLEQPDGTPVDVNLIDVLDYVADCVMAGMARSGSVYQLKLGPELLERAFQNTVELLKSQVVVEQPQTDDAVVPVGDRDHEPSTRVEKDV